MDKITLAHDSTIDGISDLMMDSSVWTPKHPWHNVTSDIPPLFCTFNKLLTFQLLKWIIKTFEIALSKNTARVRNLREILMVHAFFYVFLILIVRNKILDSLSRLLRVEMPQNSWILIGVSLSVFIRVMENQNTNERRKNHELRFNKSYEIIRNIINRFENTKSITLNCRQKYFSRRYHESKFVDVNDELWNRTEATENEEEKPDMILYSNRLL